MCSFFLSSKRPFIICLILVSSIIEISCENVTPCSTSASSEDCTSSHCIWFGDSCHDPIIFRTKRSPNDLERNLELAQATIEACQRSQSEVIGIPKTTKQILVTTGFVWIIIIATALFLVRKKKSTEQAPQRILHKVTYESIQPQETTHTICENSNTPNYSSPNHVIEYGGNDNIDGYSYEKPTNNGWLTKFIFIGVVILAMIAYFPKRPQVNLCESEVQWDAFLEKIISHHGNTKVTGNEENENDFFPDSYILLSVYNPNLYDVQVDSAQIDLRYEDMRFGSLFSDSVLLKAKSITDDLVLTKFQPENFQVTFDLLSNYLHKRELHFTLSVKTKITLPFLFHLSCNINLKHMDLDLTKGELYNPHNKTLCACNA